VKQFTLAQVFWKGIDYAFKVEVQDVIIMGTAMLQPTMQKPLERPAPAYPASTNAS
jgi:hypothetical protein